MALDTRRHLVDHYFDGLGAFSPPSPPGTPISKTCRILRSQHGADLDAHGLAGPT